MYCCIFERGVHTSISVVDFVCSVVISSSSFSNSSSFECSCVSLEVRFSVTFLVVSLRLTEPTFPSLVSMVSSTRVSFVLDNVGLSCSGLLSYIQFKLQKKIEILRKILSLNHLHLKNEITANVISNDYFSAKEIGVVNVRFPILVV